MLRSPNSNNHAVRSPGIAIGEGIDDDIKIMGVEAPSVLRGIDGPHRHLDPKFLQVLANGSTIRSQVGVPSMISIEGCIVLVQVTVLHHPASLFQEFGCHPVVFA